MIARMPRPRLRDGVVLIDRPDDSVLVSPTTLTLPALTAAERRWLADVNGLTTRTELLSTAPSTRAPQLLLALAEAGALHDGEELPSLLRACTSTERVAILDERDAHAFALGSAAPAEELIVRRRSMKVRVSGSGAIAAAIRDALFACGFPASERSPALVVLAERGHVDVFDDGGYTSLDLPHLQVRAHAHRARVGPFVVPGRTSCLRCAHSHAIDADPLWPVTSLRLARATRGLEVHNPALLHLAVAHAVAAVTGWADFGELSAASLEFTLPGPKAEWVERPPHPLCGCTWAQPARAR